MRSVRLENDRPTNVTRSACLSGVAVLLLWATGCGSNTVSTPPTKTQSGPQTYFAPFVAATTNGPQNTVLTGAEIYAIDDFADTFSQSTFELELPQQQGPQVINVGVTTAAQRGLLELGITTNYSPQ